MTTWLHDTFRSTLTILKLIETDGNAKETQTMWNKLTLTIFYHLSFGDLGNFGKRCMSSLVEDREATAVPGAIDVPGATATP